MKVHQLPFILLAVFSLQTVAQTAPSGANALVGTWMETSDSLKEIKIISPTHVFFYVQNTKKDTFAYAGAGTYSIKGDQYTEHLQYANFETKELKASFDYKIQGDQFKQAGTLVMADGRQEKINHTFTKVKADKISNGPHVGTWNQLSSSFTMADGNKGSHTNSTHIRFQVITPTHWMRISMANNQFENAFGGSYNLDGDKITSTIDYGSVPGMKGTIVEITQRIEGNKLYWQGIGKDASGKIAVQFEDVFERVNAQGGNKTTAE